MFSICLNNLQKKKQHKIGRVVRKARISCNLGFKKWVLKNVCIFKPTYQHIYLHYSTYIMSLPDIKDVKKKVKKKTRNYFITFTSGGTEEEYTELYSKVKNYKKFKITHIEGVIEYTKNKMPHLHIYTKGDNYIQLERLKRLWKKSSIDIKPVYKDNGIGDYLSKDANRIVL